MRVLYLVPQPKSPGRLAAYTFLDEEITALAAAGVEAFLISTQAERDTVVGGVQVKAFPVDSPSERRQTVGFMLRRLRRIPAASLLPARRLYRAMRIERFAARLTLEHGIDVIHSHFGWPRGFGGSLAQATTGRPLIATLRGVDILLDPSIGYGQRSSRSYDRAIRRLLRQADRTVYFSNYMKEQGLVLGARPDAARVIRKGVDARHFRVAPDRLAARRQLNLPDRPMILTVGGLIPRKGIDVILRALSEIRGDHDFSFVVCGEGPERQRLETLALDLGLDERTWFAGRVPRDEIQNYFAACDVFVLASSKEAAGNVLFEAMASGRPVICTAAGGPSEYVREGISGLVVPVGEPHALAQRIKHLLDEPELADTLGGEGRRLALSEFSYDRMVADIRALYQEFAPDERGGGGTSSPDSGSRGS